MELLETILCVSFLAGVLVAGIWDLKERRIPNLLNLALFLLGLAHGWVAGRVFSSLEGAACGIAVLVLPALLLRLPVLKAVGGGDVKLVAALGSFYGLPKLFWVLLAGSILAFLGGMVNLLLKGKLKTYLLLRPFGVPDIPEAYVPFGSYLALGVFITEVSAVVRAVFC